MADDCVGDVDLVALLGNFEPLPDALFSSGGAARPTDVLDGDYEASAPAVARELVNSTSATPKQHAQESTQAAPRDGGRRARYRARSRNEIMYLREVVEELEHDIKRFKHRKAASRGGGDGSELTKAVVWRALAVRQRLERQQAEAENARLRVLLENQFHFAAELQYVLHQRVSGASLSVSPGPQRVGIGTADASILESYLEELDNIHTRTDEVLRETGIDLRPESPHRVIRMEHNANVTPIGVPQAGTYVEFLDTHVIRADLDTARHIWPVLVQHYMQRNGAIYEPKASQSGVLTFTYGFPYKWFGRDSSVSITQSVKTFDERDRQVNVYRVLSVGEGALAGLATDQTGWSVLTRSRTNPKHTVCRVVARLTPMRFHRLESRSPEDAPPELVEFAKSIFRTCDIDVGKTIAQLEQVASEPAHYALEVTERK